MDIRFSDKVRSDPVQKGDQSSGGGTCRSESKLVSKEVRKRGYIEKWVQVVADNQFFQDRGEKGKNGNWSIVGQFRWGRDLWNRGNDSTFPLGRYRRGAERKVIQEGKGLSDERRRKARKPRGYSVCTNSICLRLR